MSRVRDVDAPRAGMDSDAGRKQELSSDLGKTRVDRPSGGQAAIFLRAGNLLAQECDEVLRHCLALMPTDHAPLWIDEDQGRPGAHGVRLPDGEVGIVHDGMVQVLPLGGGEDAARLMLRRELAAMHTDDRDRVAQRRFDLPQLRQDVLAVRSAVRPEVEDYDAAPEVLEPEWLSTDEVASSWKVGRVHTAEVSQGHVDSPLPQSPGGKMYFGGATFAPVSSVI